MDTPLYRPDPTRVILRSPMDPASKLVALAIATYGNPQMSMARLAELTGLAPSTCRRRLAAGAESGWLEVSPVLGEASRYRILWSALVSVAAA